MSEGMVFIHRLESGRARIMVEEDVMNLEETLQCLRRQMGGMENASVRVLGSGCIQMFMQPENIAPDRNDPALDVVLDIGERKFAYMMYSSEFHAVKEHWKKKRWGFSAVTLTGQTVEVEEYDTEHHLIQGGSTVFDEDNRRLYKKKDKESDTWINTILHTFGFGKL